MFWKFGGQVRKSKGKKKIKKKLSTSNCISINNMHLPIIKKISR
jgi:hypothetical protein